MSAPQTATSRWRPSEWTGQSLSALRIITAVLFLEHGSQKLLGLPLGPRAFAEPLSLHWWAGAIELFAGALIALGLFTRPTAFLASGTMAFAYWIGHAPKDFFPTNNGGDAALLYCFFFLYLVIAGPGPWSLDHVWAWRRQPTPGVPVTERPSARP